jgi:hypothetical protein
MGLVPGRIVHYVLPDGPHAGEHRPAIVVRVWSEVGVNLQVFMDGANDRVSGPGVVWATSVLYADPAEHKPRTWHWIERA